MPGSTAAMFHRAMRTDARRMSPHLFRMLFAGLILCSLVIAHIRSLSLGAPGLFFFSNILWLNFALIVLAAASFLATAITEEKEEGTLGLLLLAGVSPLAMLLGKSASRQFSTALLLVVQFPFALMAIVLGGVTFTQIVAGYVALAAFLALAANIALLASVICRRSGNAGGVTFLVLGLVLGRQLVLRLVLVTVAYVRVHLFGPEEGGPSSVANWWRETDWVGDVLSRAVMREWTDAFDSLNIVTRLQTIGSSGFAESVISGQVLVDLGAAASLFGLAWCVFIPATRTALTGVPPRGPVATKSVRRRQKRLRLPRRLAAGRTWRMAIAWKEFHFTTGGLVYFVLKTLGYGVFVGCSEWLFYAANNEHWLRDSVVPLTVFLLFAMSIEAAVFASRVFHDERKHHTLGVTLGFPVPIWRIVVEKLVGCALGLSPAALWLLAGFLVDRSVAVRLAGAYEAWIAGLVYLVFVHLVMLLSLYVRWGALPLALALMVVVGGCGVPLLWVPTVAVGSVTGREGAMALPTIYACSVAVAVLLGLIVLRLKSLAAE
ncbi:MAG TPA: hypothetical protein DER64_15175 [Planctomycetaceae bacterium]|nr:hypothetical protein [Planctomycetaceae bacterium]